MAVADTGNARDLVARMFLVTLGLFMFSTSPAVAVTTSSSPPTTSPLPALNKQAAKALQPLLIFGAVIAAVSVIAGQMTRQKKRRRREAKGQAKSRRRSKPVRPASTGSESHRSTGSRRPGPQPSTTASDERSAPTVLTSTSQSGHMWGRTPGGSAAQRATELDRERAAWAAGDSGEQQVAAELAQLPKDEWWVFHDLPRGPSGTNVDHLVIGVGGVFTLNTKNLSGNVWVGERTLMVAGVKTNFLPVAVSEAHDVAHRLSGLATMSVLVWPVLVFVHPITVAAMPPNVAVLQLDNLRTWLESLPGVLTPQHAYEFVLVANRSTTWV